MWLRLQQAVSDPTGWDSYAHPEWGYVKFGHTDPLRSNSGFMAVLLMTYNYFGKTSGLTAEDILADQGYQDWFLAFEQSISEFEYSTGPLMEKMIAYGPSTYDMVAVYEATAIEQAENAVGRYGELRVYYPPATVWSDHPFCLLDAEWVTPEKARAAQVFMDYLLTEEAQQTALLQYGFRPALAGIPLEQPGSPFERYAANGFQANLSSLPTVEVPPGNVLSTLLDFWTRNVQR
jgi:ABC-type Fe3+ transport system substrate-binding protein